jgi:methyl-accepting chemotaxis protein
MKIGVKLVTIISIFSIIGIGLVAGFILLQSQREISRLVDDNAYNLAVQSGEKIQNRIGKYMDAARTITKLMEGYKDIPVADRRSQFDRMLKQVVITTPGLGNMYAHFAPNALDGMDAEYVNTPGTDETGRFMSSWVEILETGDIILTTVGMDWNTTMQLNITGEYILEPFEYSIAGENFLAATFGIPIKENGGIIGYVGGSVDLSLIPAIVNEIKPFGDGYALVFSAGGIVAAHTDQSRLGKDIRESERDTFGPFLATLVEAISSGKPASFSYRPQGADTVMQYYSVPFTIGDTHTPWSLVVGVSQNTIRAPLYHMLRICLIISALSIALMVTGVLFIARSISRPIKTLTLMLKDISEGEGDLTKTIIIKDTSEIGDLARYFNLTISKIRNLVLSIRKKAELLSLTGSELAGNMTETAAAINEITASMRSIKSQTQRQVLSLKGTGTVMDKVVATIETLNDQSQKQTECVSQSSSAVEQMLTNIQSVTQTLVKNEGNVNKLALASHIGYTGLQDVSNDIREIARESEGLLEINGVMENIASQTNLLSMNAAIEAAHAGDVGKGFAVVADEIRKLAESSGEQSQTIREVLAKIKDAIDKITTAANEVLQNFEAISEGVRTVTDQETSMRHAMEEQGNESKAMLESMSRLHEITGAVKESAQGMMSGSHGVLQESQTLEQITFEIGNGIQEMAAGAEQINIAVSRVNDISLKNKKEIDMLIAEVSRFKVDDQG